MKMIVAGVISLPVAVVLMCLGHMWALLLFLAGFGMIVAGWARMYKGAGYRESFGPLNGLNGQGRQQSEAVKDPKAPQAYEDKSPAIWDQMENK